VTITRLRTAPLLLAATLATAAPGPALAAPPSGTLRWGASADLGVGLDAASFRPRLRGALGVRRALGSRLEAALAFTLGSAEESLDLGANASGAVCFRPWRLTLALGWRLGVSGFHVNRPVGSVWTAALVTGPLFELRYPLGSRLELRAAPLDVFFLWNDLWMASWEPRVGLAYRF